MTSMADSGIPQGKFSRVRRRRSLETAVTASEARKAYWVRGA